MTNSVPNKILLWGGTGQAKILRPMIESLGSRVAVVIDDTPGLKSPFQDVEIFEGYRGFKKWIAGQDPKQLGFLVAIGNPHGAVRQKLHALLCAEGLKPVTIVHSTAWVDRNAVLGEGTQVLAHALVAVETRIGMECIINSGATVEHECVLANGVEIGPSATLCGNVVISENTWICAGAVVRQKIKIGSNVIVGAGAVVVKDVPDGMTVVGVPAKELKRKREQQR